MSTNLSFAPMKQYAITFLNCDSSRIKIGIQYLNGAISEWLMDFN
jgi:hypothetical protein